MKLKGVNGQVLVRTQLMDNVNESGLVIDTSFAPDKYASRSGVVTSVPKKADWDIHRIELEVGDTVFFHYLSIGKAKQKNAVFPSEEGGYIIPIQNSMIYAKIDSKGNIHAINNSVLVEPMSNPAHNFKETELFIPKHKLQATISYRGRVKYISKNYTPVKDKFKVGDVVVFRKFSDHPIQLPNIKRSINENLFRISNRSNIFGVER